MHPFTLDNHFSFGYGRTAFDWSARGPGSTLWCAFTRAQREPGTFRQECVRAARLLAEQAATLGRVPTVLLSGGLDSEVVVKAFIEAGVNFQAVTFRFHGGFNAHEMRYVYQFLKSVDIRHRFYDFDLVKWIQTDEFIEMFHGAHASSLIVMPHMKAMNHVWFELGGLPILGNGDVYLENDGGWNYVELEYMLCWYRHAIRMGILGGIGFFQHTPEVTLSMLREPRMVRLGRNQDTYANRVYETSRFVKYAIYRSHWPELVMRPKLAGHEMAKDLFDARSKEVLGDRDPWADKWVVSYDDLRSQLEPDEQAYRSGAGLGPRQTAGQWRAGSSSAAAASSCSPSEDAAGSPRPGSQTAAA